MTNAGAEKTTQAGGPSWLARIAQHRVASALGGALLGGVVGMLVSWGWGAVTNAASLDDVIAQQKQSFSAIEESLAKLQASSSPEELRAIAQELRSEIGTQERIATRYQAELSTADRELTQLRKQLVASQSGYAGGSEFWLSAGDSIRLAGEGNVIGLGQAWAIYADVVMGGSSHRLQVGQELPFDADGRSCKVIFRQAVRPDDSRAGFDVACAGPPPAAAAG